MRDPHEGLTADGMIRTGADRARVPPAFEPLLADVLRELPAAGPSAELHLYGSVATGQARAGESDVDLLVIDGSRDWADEIGAQLSSRYAHLCRGVEIGTGRTADYLRDGDEAYGNRVFLRHYCVPLGGPDVVRSRSDFAGDVRAARGFNGDIAMHLARWRSGGAGPRPVARKTLVAAAGVISVRGRTWTTDRAAAAHAWEQLDPSRRDAVRALLAWADGTLVPADHEVRDALADGGIVASIADRFVAEIGEWADGTASRYSAPG